MINSVIESMYPAGSALKKELKWNIVLVICVQTEINHLLL